MITNDKVAEVRQTCGACPEQYSGTLTDGRPFYFWYRFGWASLAVGGDCEGREDAGMKHGASLQGMFGSAGARNSVFAQLLKAIEDVAALDRVIDVD